MTEYQVQQQLDHITDHMYIAQERSREALEQLIGELSVCPPAYTSYGGCLHAMFVHDYDTAVSYAYQALEQAHRDATNYIIVQAHMSLAFIFDNRKIYDRAFEHYNAVLTYEESARALNNIASIHMILDSWDEACMYLTRAEAAIDGAHPRIASIIYANLAECDCEAGRIEDAVEHLKSSEAYNSLYRETVPAFIDNIHAMIAMKQGRYRDALGILEQAGTKIDQEGMLRYFLDILRWTARCHIHLGEPEAALREYLKIEELRVMYSYGLRGLSDIEALIDLYTTLGRDAEVCELYREYRRWVQEHVQARRVQNLENIQAQIRMQESRRREEQYARLYSSTKSISEIGREILSTESPSDVLNDLHMRLSELLQVDRILIGILDDPAGQLECQWESIDSRSSGPVLIPLDPGSLEQQVIEQCVPISAVLDEKQLGDYDPGVYRDIYDRSSSVIMCPLHINGSILGLIAVHSFSVRNFSKYEVEMLTMVASFIAAAMQNWDRSRRLLLENRELERKTLTDALTGIGNRFAMERRFRELVQEQHASVTVAMIDIDQFKEYNDRFGHDQGDACLRSVADVLSGYLDTRGNRLFRYGGDEFIAVLVDQDPAGAGILLGKVCEAVRCRTGEVLQRHSAVTCSIGWHHSERIEDLKDMLHAYRKADAALYHAKECGRDGAVASTQLAGRDHRCARERSFQG